MKLKPALLATMLFATGSVSAQSGGYYEFIPYYGNDPFKFCTLGVPWHCWAPVNPMTGQFTVTNQYCFNAASAIQYARVCPKAFQSENGLGSLGSLGGGGQRGGSEGWVRASQSGDPANASP